MRSPYRLPLRGLFSDCMGCGWQGPSSSLGSLEKREGEASPAKSPMGGAHAAAKAALERRRTGPGLGPAADQADSLVAFHADGNRLYYAEARDMWVRVGSVEAEARTETSLGAQAGPGARGSTAPSVKVFALPSVPHPCEGTTTYAERCTAIAWFPHQRHQFPLLLVGFSNGAFLAMSPDGELVFLYAGLNTLGRGAACTQSAPIQQFSTPLDGPGTSEFGLVVKQPSAAVFITCMDFYEALDRNYRVSGFLPFYLDEVDVSGIPWDACDGTPSGPQPSGTPGTPGTSGTAETSGGYRVCTMDQPGLNFAGPLPPALARELSRPSTGGTRREGQGERSERSERLERPERDALTGNPASGPSDPRTGGRDAADLSADLAADPAAGAPRGLARGKRKTASPSSIRAIKINVVESERIVVSGKGGQAGESAFAMHGVENVRHGYLAVSTGLEATYYCPLLSCYAVSYASLSLAAERPQARLRRSMSLSPACPPARLSAEGPADFLGSRQSALFVGPRPGIVKVSTITSDVGRLELSADTTNLINFMRAGMFPRSSGGPTIAISPARGRHFSPAPQAPPGLSPTNRYFDLSLAPISIESINSVVFIARYTYSLLADFFDLSFGFLEGDFSLPGDAEANPGCVHLLYSSRPLRHALDALPRACDLRTAIRTSEFHTSSVSVDLLGLIKETYGQHWREITGLFEVGYEVPYITWADLADAAEPSQAGEKAGQNSSHLSAAAPRSAAAGCRNHTDSIPFLAALTNRDELVVVNLDSMEMTGATMVVRRYENDLYARLKRFVKARATGGGGEENPAPGAAVAATAGAADAADPLLPARIIAKISMCTQIEKGRRVLYVCLTYCGCGVEAVDALYAGCADGGAEGVEGKAGSPRAAEPTRKPLRRSLIAALSPHTLQVLERWEAPATMLVQIGAEGYALRPDGLWPMRLAAEGDGFAAPSSSARPGL